ncbi:MAG: M13 family metallopeptidase [Gemmatimonadaceae bacterium]|nr:M13 family metallopeptidase [Gemmatimonadaceae bacterium]
MKLRALALVAIVAASSTALGAQAASKAVDRTNMDTTCAPCTDFYRFVNGRWQDTATIPASYPGIGVGREVYDRSLDVLHAILEDAAKTRGAAPNSNTQKLGAFYGACSDSSRAEKLGATPMAADLARIAAIRTPAMLQAELARQQANGADLAFSVGTEPDFKNTKLTVAALGQGGLGLPDREYYLGDDSASVKLRESYRAHIARTLRLLGGTPAGAADEAKRVLALETSLAKAAMPLEEQRDPKNIYHPLTVDSIARIAPGVNWKAYFASVGMTPKSVIVQSPSYLTAVGKLVSSVPMATWRDYLRWRVTDNASPYLSSRFVNERFTMRALLTGAKSLPPRWKRCMTTTDASLGEALGAAYVAKEFSPEAKARALAMVGNLEAALRDRISTLDWMSEATRKEALAKLAAFRVKIGYPDRFRDYSGLRIPPGASYYASVMLANQFEFRRQMAKSDKPTDRNEWGMTPQTVDAYNDALNNEIVFPAGIMQPPFFDATADDASNYGAMGAIIGHEITHGYDDEGRQFDASGALRDWWTKDDADKYDVAAGRIRDQYSSYIVADTFHVNGKLTLGENIADFGGLKIAYAAFEKAMSGRSRAPIDGFTPEQRFFIAYASAWRTKIRPETMILQSRTDPHSPGEWRVIGALSNLPEFAQAFGCKAGDPMVRGEAIRATIW